MTDPAIREPMSFRSEFRFFLRDIPVEITLRLLQSHSLRVAIIVRQSHLISVPGLDRQEQASCEDQTQDGEVLQSVSQRVRLRLQRRNRKGPET